MKTSTCKLKNFFAKIFGGLNITWPRLIIAAIIIGVVVGTLMTLPFLKDTSFQDIGISFECWILFGIIIIVNSKTPLDAALKCFIFFLISQPLIYLVQVPFYSDGFGIFNYYGRWFIWTLCTLPMGFIGYYIKRGNLLSSLILATMTSFLAVLGVDYIHRFASIFPNHLLTIVFCFALIPCLIFAILKGAKERIVAFVITLIAAIAIIFYVGNSVYELSTAVNPADYGLSVDSGWTAKIEGAAPGEVAIEEVEDQYYLSITIEASKDYDVTLRSDTGEEYRYDVIYDAETGGVRLAE